MTDTKCTMTGCGIPPTQTVVLAARGVVADDGVMNTGALTDIAMFPACGEHVDHIAKVFYGAAYALGGVVTPEGAVRTGMNG